ncbi:hypothetical protein QCA50_005956 [Cerrena zonata]|uniref:Uncharacterized protein n=1 Tax=Cerrena zonata TaxID=2478898 RepID=A0AAW0GGK8_9APHY
MMDSLESRKGSSTWTGGTPICQNLASTSFIAGITKASDSPDTSSRRLEGSLGEDAPWVASLFMTLALESVGARQIEEVG